MKTIFTLFASLIMSISLFAADARPKSMLTVKSLDDVNIRVVLDNHSFEPDHHSMMVQGIDAGYHQVTVYRQKNNGLLNVFGKRYEMVYSTSLMVKPRTSITISIDCFGNASVDETKIRGNLYNKGRDRDDDQGYASAHSGSFGDYDTHYGYDRGMDDRQFNQVLQSISKEWLESNKLKSATKIVTTNSLTSAQVKQMVLLFNFENNKLELAKQAYANTVDKKNYYMINDAFSFNSSKEELACYIRDFR